MKQETLEEAAEKYAHKSFIWPLNKQGDKQSIPPGQVVPSGYAKHKKTATKHFTAGYKLAQERSYSEEDFKLFARQYFREIKMDKSNLLWNELADKCLEQFKKK